jgi:hypothetical protein
VRVADLLRKHGISRPTPCKWRSKYGGVRVVNYSYRPADLPIVAARRRDRSRTPAFAEWGATGLPV